MRFLAILKTILAVSVFTISFSTRAETAALEVSKADTYKVASADINHLVPLNGTLQPLQMVNVNAQVDGEIQEVLVREGDQVKKGQVLARFATVELAAHLNERVAALEGAKAQQALAEKNFDKVQNLFGKKYLSQTDFDTAQNQLTIAVSNVKAAESGVDLAKKALSDAEVKAPLDGIVSERFAEPGQRTAMHVRLFVIVNLTELEFTASVPSADIPLVKVGQTATFVVDGFVNRIFTARVTRINPMALAGPRSYYVYLSVANDDQALRGGMLARGDLVVESRKTVPCVPTSALHENTGGGKSVYLIQDNVITDVPVELGMVDSSSGLVEIKKGISSGALVLNNRAKVDSGRAVRLLEN